MRTLGRLIEVLRTVNPNACGKVGTILNETADCLELRHFNCGYCRHFLPKVADGNASPHLRELASEALAHMAEGRVA